MMHMQVLNQVKDHGVVFTALNVWIKSLSKTAYLLKQMSAKIEFNKFKRHQKNLQTEMNKNLESIKRLGDILTERYPQLQGLKQSISTRRKKSRRTQEERKPAFHRSMLPRFREHGDNKQYK